MVKKNRKPRALVVVGAGASVEYGIPATTQLGSLIEVGVAADRYCAKVGGVDVYRDVKTALEDYYDGNSSEAHFERIYHVMRELHALHRTPRAVPKFSPVMLPFLNKQKNYSQESLQAACQTMLAVIYKEASTVCDSPKKPLKSLESFFSQLEEHFLPRVYTTNYDDFIGQATNDRYFTGFTRSCGTHALFDPHSYWSHWDDPALFHVHGSIHMGFPLPQDGCEIGELAWYPSRAEALKCSGFNGSSLGRMDGTGIERSAIITGLDKLGRLQQMPYALYYAGLSRDAMEADVVFILGSGLADLHLNTWLREARRHRQRLPLLYVGYWPGDTTELFSRFHFDYEDREIALFHDLRIDLANVPESHFKEASGWTIDAHKTAAVWADGFQAFLSHPDALAGAMKEIGA